MDSSVIDRLEAEFDGITTSLTANTKGVLTYPFMFIEDVSEVEMKYLKKVLSGGNTPLMLKLEKGYAQIALTSLTLDTVKHLSRFKDRQIWIKVSKKEKKPIEEMLPFLLLE
jgi:hypothetical protein